MIDPIEYSETVRALRLINAESLRRENEGKKPFTKTMATKRAELVEILHTKSEPHLPCAVCESGNYDTTGVL